MATARETDIRISFEVNNRPLDNLNDRIDRLVGRVTGGMQTSENRINRTTEAFTRMSSRANSSFSSMQSSANNVAERINRITGVTRNAGNEINRTTSMFSRWGQATTTAVNGISRLDSKVSTVMYRISSKINEIGTTAKNVGEKIATPFTKAFDKIKTKVVGTKNNVKFFANSVTNAVKNSSSLNKISSYFNKIRDAIGKVASPLGRLPTMFQRVRSTAQEAGSRGTSGMQSLTGAIFKANLALDVLKAGFQKIIQSIGTMISTTDTWINTQSRLGLIVDEGSNVEELQNKILGAAQRSQGDYTEMASSVAKLDLLAGNAFKDDDEVVKFSELMQKAFAMSGTGNEAQKNSMRQLTQAMGSGRLQGDEYVSILEGAPLLAKYIAKTMTGKDDVGPLKKLSSEGLITADIIKEALFAAQQDIEKGFGSMPITFAGAWTMIKNDALFAFKEVMEGMNKALNSEKGKKAIETITKAIKKAGEVAKTVFAWMGEHLDIVIGAVVVVGSVISGFLIGSLVKLFALILTNPVTWITLAIVALVATLYMAYQKCEWFRNAVNNLWSKLKEFWNIIKTVTGALFGNKDAMETLKQKYPEMYEKVETVRAKFIEFKDSVVEAWESIKAKAVEVWETYLKPALENFKNGFIQVRDTILNAWNEHIKPILDKWAERFTEIWNNNIKPFVDKFVDGWGRIVSAVSQLWNEFLAPFFNWLVDKFNTYVLPVIETVGDIFGSVFGAIIDIVGGLWDILVGLIEFIVGVFTGDWERAWEGIKTITSGIGEALKGIVQGIVNVIIDLVNFAIRQLNKVSVGLPEWDILGDAKGKKFGFNIKEISHVEFEQGTKGAYNTPDSFLAGENGPEWITGAKNKRVHTASDTERMLGSNETNTYNITINVNGGDSPIETAKSVRQELEDYFASFGRRNPRLKEV